MPSPTHFPASRLRPTALACTSLILGVMLSGCGGGSSGDAVTQTDSGYQVASGVAQKGPLARGSWISINELNPNTLAPVGTSFNFEIRDDLGTFQPDSTVFTRPLLESTAMGYYFDELTGKVSTDVVILRGMSDLAVDRAVNINLLTDLANARTRALMTRTTSPLKFAAARAQAQREVLQALFLFNSSDLLPGGTTEPASFGELDLSKNRNADQVLAALSAVVTQIGVTGGGINQFINQFEADLLDDGLINNSPRFASSLTTKLNTAFKTVDFAKLAANLNTFYGTTRYTAASLSQWVDTSGGVDKVIDRYKSTAANIPVGTESKSVEYVAGTNDAGQCISSSTGKLYRNGVEVTTGTVKAVKGDKYVLGLTATTASTVNGFIQRTATSAGLCPATKPTAGIMRMMKHAVIFSDTFNPNAITAVAIGKEYYQSSDYGYAKISVYALKNDGSIYKWDNSTRGQPVPVIIKSSVKNLTTENGFIKFILPDGAEGALIHTGLISSHSYELAKIIPLTQPSSGYPEKIITECSYSTPSSKITLYSDGSIWTEGNNNYGQLGDGTTFSGSLKKIGTGYKKLFCIHTGYSRSSTPPSLMALKTDGSVWAWGHNTLGQLGDGTNTNVLAPKNIASEFSRIEHIITNSSPMNVESMTIGLKYNGSLWAWGELNNHGQLGVGSLNTTAKTPQQIGTNFTSFEILEGGNKYIAKKTDGTLWAWGRDMGKLAGTMTEDLTTPTKIISEFNAINIDNTITLGAKNDGSLWGWSTNSYGQLGDGTTNPSSTTPKLIGTKYTTASSCGKSMFAIKSDNTLWGWGDNTSGQMGDGTTTARLSQKIVGMGYISVTASGCDGNATIFARKTDGTLWGWGSNEWGQLGDGTTTNSLTPKQITLP